MRAAFLTCDHTPQSLFHSSSSHPVEGAGTSRKCRLLGGSAAACKLLWRRLKAVSRRRYRCHPGMIYSCTILYFCYGSLQKEKSAGKIVIASICFNGARRTAVVAMAKTEKCYCLGGNLNFDDKDINDGSDLQVDGIVQGI